MLLCKERQRIGHWSLCPFKGKLNILICLGMLKGFSGGSAVKNPPAKQETQETWVWFLGQEAPLEKEMATHSSILAWKILWTEEPGRLQSTGSQRVGHNWGSMCMRTCARAHTHTHTLTATLKKIWRDLKFTVLGVRLWKISDLGNIKTVNKVLESETTLLCLNSILIEIREI